MTFHKDITGEGTATTNLQQGLCKSWIHFEGDGTVAITDSFNVTTLTDNNDGDYSYTFTNNMNNASYCWAAAGTHDGGSYTTYMAVSHDNPPSTSALRMNCMNSGNSNRLDAELLTTSIHGDLA
tara:strand:+ start:1658 stop:2029 length:372 start_codon:yes stop_codon:yes gene_type:complete